MTGICEKDAASCTHCVATSLDNSTAILAKEPKARALTQIQDNLYEDLASAPRRMQNKLQNMDPHQSINSIDAMGGHSISSQRKHSSLINNESVNKESDAPIAESAERGCRQQYVAVNDARPTEASSLLPELDVRKKTITPRLSMTASPATTIYEPKPSFSGILGEGSQGHTRARSMEISPRAATLSRRSVAEIRLASLNCQPTLALESSDNSINPCHGKGGERTPSKGSSADGSLFAVHGLREANGYHWNSAGSRDARKTLEDSDSSACVTIGSNRPLGRDSNITSFPELRPRHCTNEWLKPPTEIETCYPSSDLYRSGVDAHCGLSLTTHQDCGSPRQSQNKTHDCNRRLFGKNPFGRNSSPQGQIQVADDAPVPLPGKRLGTSIGSASHRRRSSHAMEARHWNPSDHFQIRPKSVGKVRKDSEERHAPDGKQSWSNDSQARTPLNTPDEDSALVCESRFSASSPVAVAPGGAGTLGTQQSKLGGAVEITLGSGWVNDDRRDKCSEDMRPHMCEDDMDSTSTEETPTFHGGL